MAIKFFNSIDVDGEVQGTSLDINGNGDVSGTLTVDRLDVAEYVYHEDDNTYIRFLPDRIIAVASNNTVLNLNVGADTIEFGHTGKPTTLQGSSLAFTGAATFAGDIYTKNLKLGNGSTDSSIQLDGDFGGGDLTIQNLGNDKDILFKGNDNGSTITALTLDMSSGGNATFAGDVILSTTKGLYTNIIQALSNAGLQLGNDNNSGYVFVKDSGEVCVGTKTPSSNTNYGTGEFNVESDSFTAVQIMSHNSTAGNYSFLGMGKSSGTGASPTIVQANETVAGMRYYGYDGGAYRALATISAAVDGTPGSGDMPGKLEFWTTADGASSPTKRLTISSSGTASFNGHVNLDDSNHLMWGGNAIVTHTGSATNIGDNSSASALILSGGNQATFAGEVQAASLDINGNADISGNLTGVDTLTATTFSGDLNGTINTATTATTQSASNNSTKVATTAYVDTAVANLVDSAPGDLNTLNELAAALGDDENFSTTVTNSIATKLPLAGGTMSGAIAMGSQNITGVASLTAQGISASSAVTANTIQLQGDLNVLNKAQSSYLTLADRNTSGSEVVYNLDNIGTIASGAITSTGIVSVSSGNSFRLYNAAGNGWGELTLNETANKIQFNRGIQPSGDNQSDQLLGTASKRWHTVNAGAIVATGEVEGGSLDINGNADISGNLTVSGTYLTLNGEYPRIKLTDSNNNDDYDIINNNGTFIIYNDTDSSIPLAIAGDNSATFAGNVTVTGGTLNLGNDVSIFDDGTNILRTDDTFHANADIHVGGNGKLFDRADTSNYIELASTVNISTNTNVSGQIVATVSSGTNFEARKGNGTGAVGFGGTAHQTGLIEGVDGGGLKLYTAGSDVNWGGSWTLNTTWSGTQLTVAGELEAGSLDINGNADISGNLSTGNGSIECGDLDVSGVITGDGSSIDSINAGNIGSGTLAVARGGTGLTSISTLLNSNVTSVSGNAGSVTNGVYTNTTQTISGAKTFSGNTVFSGAISQSNTTQSTNKSSGAYKTSGGVGIAKTLNVGEDVVAYASSDKRYKDNLQAITNPIDKVKSLTGYTFTWNDKHEQFNGNDDIGVVAQEVEKVFPEIVDTRDNGYKAVKYEKMVAVLIEAVKDQQKQIDELKEKLNGNS